jgi:hypothetical protein
MLLEAVPEIPEWVRTRAKQGFTFPFKDWVTSEWQDVFCRIEKQSPVPLQNWYRTWCVFALESFLDRNGMGARVAKDAVRFRDSKMRRSGHLITPSLAFSTRVLKSFFPSPSE